MRNIQPWCISRQLWWGHRIPVWYGPDGKTFCEETDEAVYEAARAHYGKDVDLTQDEDVLDTWYSSGLWAFSTLGWPEQTPELERYYPTDVLVTGFDIIFFWVARMMMMSLYFMKDENGKGVVPFKDVYMHALVRDEKGQKMSKSKGNVMDPLDLCDKFGADAVRFTLAAMAAQGRDIALGESRVEGYRNFATKLWNAARFCEMNECRPVDGFNPADVKQTVNRWVIDELMKTADAAYKGFEEYRFNEAADALYHFTYGTFCDWYIEFTKPIFSGEDEGLKEEVRATTAWVLSKLLTMLSPMMPFITEEIARHLHDDKSLTLMKADWPCFDGVSTQADAAKEMNWVIDFITAIRSIRSDMNLPAGKKLPLVLKADVDNVREWTSRHQDLIKKLARLEQLELSDNLPDGSARGVIDGGSFAIPLGGVIDIAAEKERLSKEIGKVEKEIASLAGRLANENFIAKAPEAVVNEQRDRLKDYEATKEKLRQAYQTITEV
jgi:valyl-tRNA synthetase